MQTLAALTFVFPKELLVGPLMHTLSAGMFRDTCIFSIPVQVFPVSCGSWTVSLFFTLTLFEALHLNERMSSTPAAQQRSNMSQARSVLHTRHLKSSVSTEVSLLGET